MSFNVTEHVSALIGEVKSIERESETIYLNLGKLFPLLIAEMEKSSVIAQQSLEGVSSITGNSGTRGLGSMETFALDSGSYFRRIHEKDAAFLERINESIEHLSSLEVIIARVRLDSEEMEIISLNAMTVALKSGNAGKSFSVITDELKRLSGRTIALTEEITGRGRSLLDSFAKLRDYLSELDAFQGAFFTDLDETLAGGYKALEENIRGALGFFGGLLTEARGVREPVQALMQGIQHQDILRQSLQHVAISLEEAGKASAIALPSGEGANAGTAALRAEELAFVGSIADLSTSLMDDIVSQLDHGTESFETQIQTVKELVSSVESRRKAYIEDPARHAELGLNASSFSLGAQRYLVLKKNVIGMTRRLAEQVGMLNESFHNLANLLSRFQNIVVASRIEVAKNQSLNSVSTTVVGMIQLTERLGEDVSGATDRTKDFIKIASTAIADYAGGSSGRRHSSAAAQNVDYRAVSTESAVVRAEGDRLASTLHSVEMNIRELGETRSTVAAAIDNFSLYTAEFIALIHQARAELDELGKLSTRLKDIRDILSSLKDGIRETLGTEAPTAAIKNERLRAMIERFTLFTHKKTAGDIGQFDVEGGAEAGAITLF